MDYQQLKDEIYLELPVEFAQFIETYAYEKGHAYGMDEVNSMAYSMAFDFLEKYKKFAARKNIVDK